MWLRVSEEEATWTSVFRNLEQAGSWGRRASPPDPRKNCSTEGSLAPRMLGTAVAGWWVMFLLG